uniref:Uncharacterized protein n=1 Tax=Caenorhabditis japonica TaxID=281687 RepID=A0A8R1E7B0_CAEJA
MNNRSCYSEFEDVRMLKWVARKEGSEAPLGIALWQSYTDTYNSGHTPQSLNGRMRRQIIPNLYNYVRYLKTSDLASLYVMFSQRLDPDDRRRIKKYITRAREMRKERENQKNEDGDTTNMRSVSVQPHPERRQSIAKEKPTDDRDVFKRKTIGGEDSRSRLDSDGPSTSAAPPQSSKRRVIGEVSSTAEIHSDDDDSVVQKKNTRSVEKPDEEIQVISRNAVEVVSSTASFETTPSGKLEKNYNKSTNKNNSTVRSDGEEDEVVSTPKAKNQYSFDLDEDEDFLEPSYRKEDWSSKKKSNLRMQFSDDSDVDDLYVSSKITPMKVASTSTWHEQERLVIIEEADGEEEIADDDDYVSPATTPTQKTVPETTSYFGFADDDDEDYEEPLNRVQAATIVAEVIVLDEDVTDPDPDPVVPEKKSPEKAQKLDEDSEKTPKKTNMTVEIEKEVKETSEKTLKISKKTPEIEKIAREKSEKSLKISKKTAEIEKEVMETSEKSLKKSKKTAEIEKTVKETSGKTLKISKKTAEIEKEVEKEAEKDDEEEDLLQKKSKKSKKPLDEEKTLKKSKKPTLEEEEEAPSTSKKSNKHIEEEIDSKKKKSKKPEEEYIEKKSKKSKESAQEEDEKRPKRAADEMEAAVKISPPKKVARRTSSERDDAAEMSEVDKAVLEFSSHKKSKHKRKPTSPQKALPVESEDDDLADRIMATIKEREDAQRTAEANASSMQGEGEPARDEDLLKTPNDSRYVACRDLAPKDDRIDYHWVLDKSGRRRWIQKPKNMRQCSDPNSSSKSPRKKRRKMGFANRPKRRRRSRKSENKRPDPGEEKGEEEEEKEEEEEEDLV